MQEDTSADVSVDDDIADMPLVGDTTPTDTTVETTEETSTTEETAKEDGSETQETTEETTDETVEADPTEATEQEAQPEETDNKGKIDPVIAQRAWMERQRNKQAVTQQLTEQYRPKSEQEFYDEIIEEGIDPQIAELQAQLKAQAEQNAYDKQVNEIAELTTNVRSDAANVLIDFPVFNPNSPEYDEEFTKEVDAAYDQAARLQTTEDGTVLHAEVLPYEHYQRMARIYQRGTSRGVVQGQQEAAVTMSRTEPTGGTSATTKRTETLEEMGERLADVPLF